LLDVKGVVLLVFLEDFLRDNAVDVEDIIGSRPYDLSTRLQAGGDVGPGPVFFPARIQFVVVYAGDWYFRVGAITSQPPLEGRPT
jgi:hypothetical protein